MALEFHTLELRMFTVSRFQHMVSDWILHAEAGFPGLRSKMETDSPLQYTKKAYWELLQ